MVTRKHIPGLFITGTGTGVGKTFVTRALARALSRHGYRVAALKPIQTGDAEHAGDDGLSIATAAGEPSLATLPGLYRASRPVAPYAAFLEGSAPLPHLDKLAHCVAAIHRSHDLLLVEGAGGLLTPLTAHATNAELAAVLGLPILLVARDALGCLSATLAVEEAARLRELSIVAVVLARHEASVPESDASCATNYRILAERIRAPLAVLPFTRDDDDDLADAAEHSGLLTSIEQACGPTRTRSIP